METDDIQTKEEDRNSSERDTNRIMGMAAIFISILSMVAVIYQSYLAREENEMMHIQQSATVLPYLSYWYSDIDNKFKFVIANKGVGPAFIKEVELRAINTDNTENSILNSTNELMTYMKKHSDIIANTEWVKYSLKPNMLISKNETVEVLSFSFDDDNHENQIKSEFYKIFAGFNIVYEDVYGTSWNLDSDQGFPVKLNP